MNKKLPFPFICGGCLGAYALCTLIANINLIKSLMQIGGNQAIGLIISLVGSIALIISFAVFAFVSSKHKILILPVMVYCIIETIVLISNIVLKNVSLSFSFSDIGSMMTIIGEAFFEIALVMSIISFSFAKKDSSSSNNNESPRQNNYSQPGNNYSFSNNQSAPSKMSVEEAERKYYAGEISLFELEEIKSQNR